MSAVPADHVADLPALDQLLCQADEALVKTIGVRSGEIPDVASRFGQVRPFELEDFSSNLAEAEAHALNQSVNSAVTVQIEVGRAELCCEEVGQLAGGVIVPLNRLVGDPVDIRADGRLIARGEILVWNGKFCVRVVEVLSEPNRREPAG